MSQSNARIKPLQSLNKTSTPVFKLLIFKEEPWVFDFHKSQLLEGQRNSWSIVVDPLASMMHIPAVLIGLQGNPEIVYITGHISLQACFISPRQSQGSKVVSV